MSAEGKHLISHRARAAAAARELLRQLAEAPTDEAPQIDERDN
jgi:inosine/xanthosine triphosphate pyrophosphatase family protein